MPLPPAVKDFLDISSDPDLDGYNADTSFDANDANTRSSTPVMTPSDDFMLDPKNWSPFAHRRTLIDLPRLLDVVPIPTIPAHVYDPGSTTEPESEPDPPVLPAPAPTRVYDPGSTTEPESEPDPPVLPAPAPTRVYDPGSTTEPESEPDPPVLPAPAPTRVYDPGSTTEPESEPDPPVLPAPAPTRVYDPGSTTEPESEPDPPVLPVPKPDVTVSHEQTPRLDRRCMFATPSPPPPGSLYWKYFTKEEEAKFYDRAGTDKSFRVVRQMKKELQALLD